MRAASSDAGPLVASWPADAPPTRTRIALPFKSGYAN